MKKLFYAFVSVLMVLFLAACGSENQAGDGGAEDGEELLMLEVDFQVPEAAEVDEQVLLKATVTYGEEAVTDADEVVFEVWPQGQEDDSVMLDGVNNEDGAYEAEITFDSDGIYEMFAHTTARGLHTMPKKEIAVGDVDEAEVSEQESEAHDHHDTDDFVIHFDEPESIVSNEETDLVVHLQLDEQPFEEANVRYEIWQEDSDAIHEWIDAEEAVAGEYVATYEFSEAGTYQMMVHVEDDEDLHEHQEVEVVVE